MKRRYWIAGVLLAVSSTLALAQPKSLLPPGFDNPTPTPSPTPAPAPRPSAAVPSPASRPAVQPLPGVSAGATSTAAAPVPGNLPPVAELEKMDPDQLDELFGLKPKYDIPPGAQRGRHFVPFERVADLADDERAFAAKDQSHCRRYD